MGEREKETEMVREGGREVMEGGREGGASLLLILSLADCLWCIDFREPSHQGSNRILTGATQRRSSLRHPTRKHCRGNGKDQLRTPL